MGCAPIRCYRYPGWPCFARKPSYYRDSSLWCTVAPTDGYSPNLTRPAILISAIVNATDIIRDLITITLSRIPIGLFFR